MMDRPSARRQHQHAQASSSVDVVTSPTSATSTSLSDILATKRSSWPRIILHPSTGSVDWPPPSSNHPARRSSSRHGRATSRSSRRARSSSPFNGRSVDDGWVVKTCATAADLNSAATATSPVDTRSDVIKDFMFKTKAKYKGPRPKKLKAKTKNIRKPLPQRQLLALRVSIRSKANVQQLFSFVFKLLVIISRIYWISQYYDGGLYLRAKAKNTRHPWTARPSCDVWTAATRFYCDTPRRSRDPT